MGALGAAQNRSRSMVGTILETARQRCVTVALVGDSITEAAQLGANQNQGWAYLLAADLIATYGDGGGACKRPTDAAWSRSADWTTDASFGSRFGAQRTSTPGGTLTKTGVSGTIIDVYWVGTGSTQPFTVTVDGTIVGAGGGATVPWSVTEYRRSSFPVSAGSHTVVVTHAGTSNPVVIVDVVGRNNSGVRIDNWGLSGVKLTDYTDPSWLRPWRYDVVIVALLTNDYFGQIALATYAAKLAQFQSEIVRTGRMVMWAAPRESNILTIPQSSYEAQMAAQALTDPRAKYVDLPGRTNWADWTTANTAGFMLDDRHPSVAGQADMKSQIESALQATA